MGFREVSVVQIKELLRRWLTGEGERTVAKAVGLARGTARSYIGAAVELGLDRGGGEDQLTDELIGQVCERVRPRRPDGHGESWRRLLAEEKQIKAWGEDGLTVVKIGILLRRKGIDVLHRTLARFAGERCGASRRRRVTVRVDDPPPGRECQVDFGRLGLVPDGERRRLCWALTPLRTRDRAAPPGLDGCHLEQGPEQSAQVRPNVCKVTPGAHRFELAP